MNTKTKDRILGIILLLISLFFFYFTMQQESPRFEGDPGPKMFPKAIRIMKIGAQRETPAMSRAFPVCAMK